MITPKAIVMSRKEDGSLRVRADFDVNILEPIETQQTISRYMENVILSDLAYTLSDAYEAIFELLNKAIPPE